MVRSRSPAGTEQEKGLLSSQRELKRKISENTKPQNENTRADKANPAVSTVFITTIKAKQNNRRSGPGRSMTNPHGGFSHTTLGKGFPRVNQSGNSVEKLNTQLLEDSDVRTLAA